MKNEMDSVIKELEKIRKKHGGKLKAEDVVKAARAKSHPLHEKFNWDDTEAAHLYRLRQARELIRVCVIVMPVESKPMDMYVSVKSERDAGDAGFRVLSEMLSSEDTRRLVLQEALEELAVFKRKYHYLTELAGVFASIDAIESAR